MKELLSASAIVLALVAYIPYYRDILKGKTHPHLYSWVLWGLLTVLLVALQMQGGAGPAAWVTMFGGLLCLGVILLSLKRGKKDIAPSDSVMAVLSLSAIGFWWFVDQPVIAAVLAILADGFAFIPTIRKSWHKPYSETLSLYVINTVRFSLTFSAIETYTFLSASWILFWLVGNGLFSLMLVLRRKKVKKA